ncbi:unnamed protein product [Vicia faba]|uniref:Uncharacterized protein n=1 Tax=Vicia faba TaxID=3906 RepID=A0AAV0ZQ43_VICFA|nr:unnamed protein product [Vicia faba]
MATGQLFSRTTQVLFYNYKQLLIQQMLNFDFLCGRETPSVAGIINPGFEGFQKLFFWIATASSLSTLKQPTIRVVAIIVEGVPESDTKELIAYSRANNKVVIGPTTVGGIQSRDFKIGDTAGIIDNIINCKPCSGSSNGNKNKKLLTLIWGQTQQGSTRHTEDAGA